MSDLRRAQLLESALQALEEGGDAALSRYVASRPEDSAWLRERLALLQGFGILHEREPEPTDRLPTHLGEFELLEWLGSGGMGIVHRARQPSLQRDVAIKVIRPEHLFFAGARDRFRREVESIAKLQHPGIVRVYEAGDADGLPWFTMELVDGVSLEALLTALRARGAPPADDRAVAEALAKLRSERGSKSPAFEPQGRSWVETCFRWVKELAEALAYAHSLGVLHRDVKPANVMLTWSGRVLLLDFGLATTRGARRITGTGSIVGSLPYMAPEQLRGAREEVDPRTDVYSLGVTLYELLALRHPFQQRDEESEETRRRILEGTPAPLRRGAATVPWDAETVCLTAMEREPARRYAGAGALAADLGNVLQYRSIAARRPGAALRARRFTQRHPAWSVGAVLGFVLLAGGPLLLWRTQVARTRAVTAEQGRTQAALAQVDRQRELAEGRFDLALDAVTNVVTRIGMVELKDVPDAGEVRRELLELAEKSAQRLLAELPDHPRARFVASSVDQQLALVLLDRGQFDAARRHATRALATLGGAVGAGAPDLARSLLRGRCEAVLAKADLQQSRFGTAGPHYIAAMELHRAAIAATDDVSIQEDHQRELAACLLNWGTTLALKLRRVDEGAAAIEEACELIDEIGSAPADAIRLAQALTNLGTIHDELGQPERSKELFERAVAMFRESVAADPRSCEARHCLAHGLSNLAIEQGKLEEFDRSIPALDESVALFRALCADFPERSDFRERLANVLANLGSHQSECDRTEAAVRSLEESLALYDGLAAAADAAPETLAERALTESHLAVTLRATGRATDADALRARAIADIAEVRRRFPDSGKRIETIRGFIESNE